MKNENKDEERLEKADLSFKIWPLEGEEHPISTDNIVEEAYHDRLFRIAKEVN